MKPILCVGMVCEDTVVKVEKFPEEDSDQRLKDITNLDFSTPDFSTILQPDPRTTKLNGPNS